MRKMLIVLAVFCLLLTGCSEDKDDNNDLFRIKVENGSGETVSGLEVSVRNYGIDNSIPIYRPSTTIRFICIDIYRVKLQIFDQEDLLVRTLIDEPIDIGHHAVHWDGKDEEGEIAGAGGTRVFHYELTCYDLEIDEIEFKDTKDLCMFFFPEEPGSIIGFTDESGGFSYNNKLAFPHLFEPENQDIIDSFGCTIGELSFSDSVIIRLHDPVEGLYMEFTKAMTESSNHYELVWDDPQEDEVCRDGSRYVELSEFTGEYDIMENVVRLNWTTELEVNSAGFNIYRQENEWGNLIQINPEMIAGAGTCSIPTDYSFIDENVEYETTVYNYFLEAIDYSGETSNAGSVNVVITVDNPEIPEENRLEQNYPNPFN